MAEFAAASGGTMNMKRYFLGVLGAFVSLMILGWLLHGTLLKATYAPAITAGLMRTEPEMMARFHFLALGYLAFALAAVWIYAYGVERKPWLGQGVRYGIALWVLGSLTPSLAFYAVQPWEPTMMAKSTGVDLVIMVITGLVIAAIYRESAGIPRSAGARA
jgi:hypothetical protein